VIVLAAGSFMHFLLAAVLIFGLALTIGIENDNTRSWARWRPASPRVSRRSPTAPPAPAASEVARGDRRLKVGRRGDFVHGDRGVQLDAAVRRDLAGQAGRAGSLTVERPGIL